MDHKALICDMAVQTRYNKDGRRRVQLMLGMLVEHNTEEIKNGIVLPITLS